MAARAHHMVRSCAVLVDGLPKQRLLHFTATSPVGACFIATALIKGRAACSLWRRNLLDTMISSSDTWLCA